VVDRGKKFSLARGDAFQPQLALRGRPAVAGAEAVSAAARYQAEFDVSTALALRRDTELLGCTVRSRKYPGLNRGARAVSAESALEQADEDEEQKLLQNKAKQKKRASHAVTKSIVNSDTGTTVKQQKEKKETDEMVNRRTVFVGNLPVNCTVQALKSLFKEYGQIKSIRFRSLLCVTTEEASVSLCLPADISDDAVREHFSVCGGVVAVRIVRDRKTGLGKGFGYVLFENTDAVHLALKLNETVLMGRKIRVKRCGEKWKAPQKSADQSRAPKDRFDTTLKNNRCSNDSFVGEKAVPLKKSTKPKRLRTLPRNKAGKNKQFSDKKSNV
uniref:RNA binding motif protein 34 n=1 Tax=Buteo japonicus TaxID=224669 RepID=A0A8C0C5A6_9AVES